MTADSDRQRAAIAQLRSAASAVESYDRDRRRLAARPLQQWRGARRDAFVRELDFQRADASQLVWALRELASAAEAQLNALADLARAQAQTQTQTQ